MFLLLSVCLTMDTERILSGAVLFTHKRQIGFVHGGHARARGSLMSTLGEEVGNNTGDHGDMEIAPKENPVPKRNPDFKSRKNADFSPKNEWPLRANFSEVVVQVTLFNNYGSMQHFGRDSISPSPPPLAPLKTERQVAVDGILGVSSSLINGYWYPNGASFTAPAASPPSPRPEPLIRPACECM